MHGSPLIRGFLFFIFLSFTQVAATKFDETPIIAADIWFQAEDFAQGQGEDTVASPAGLAMAQSVPRAVYTSPQLEAPIPFNALLPQWRAEIPVSDDEEHLLEFEFRTAKADQWTEWFPLHESHDNAVEGDPFIRGDMLVVPAEDITHGHVQFRVIMTRVPGNASPHLHSLKLTFIDSTAGPTTEELLAEQTRQEPSQEDGAFPKPAVIPRSSWCTAAECNYTDGLEYHPVTHLILHHTVTSTGGGNTAATVRAIWYGHTFNNGWGDIGYNYLIDVNGVIFEGHLGGDDVVGTHAAGANRGSMAASLIGNFVDVAPPQAMLNAAADLFAWKADQKNIDIYDSGNLPDMDWGLPKLMGHRDVYGTTQCPGDQAHALLPTLREMIAQRINFTPPHLYFDELDPDTNFSRSNASWLVGPASCGFDVHAYYAWSTTNPGDSQHSATWRPQVNVPGEYELSVYAPYCRTRARDTLGAVYRVTDPNGSSTVIVNQEQNLGLWVPIGTYTFDGASTSISLSNLTSTDEDHGVWFDAIRLRYQEPGALNRQPEADNWQRSLTVPFQWTVTNGAVVQQQILQVASEPSFSNPMLSWTLGASARSLTHTFSEEHVQLYWRVILVTASGQLIHSTSTGFGIDTSPPASLAFAVLRFPDDRLMVVWQGEDDGAGITGYNIDYRAEGSASWVRWLDNTQATLATFTPPQFNTTYWFRSQAIDGSGLVEATHSGNGDSSTAQARFMNEEVRLPLIQR